MWKVALVAVVASLTIYSVIDIAGTNRSSVRQLPKWAWVWVALLLPVVGPVLWLTRGRPERAPRQQARPVRPVAPDDDPAFLATLDKRATPAPDPAAGEDSCAGSEAKGLDAPNPTAGDVEHPTDPDHKKRGSGSDGK